MLALPPSNKSGLKAVSWPELRGMVERITYQHPEDGYTVARLIPERAGLEAEVARGDDRLVTVVGTPANLTPGEAIVAQGRWRNDPKHG
jgi:exodeoxyribonuclease V alpha subunit